MQQVVENLAVQLGLALVVGLERGQGRLARASRHSPCGSPPCAAPPARGHDVRLQIEHDLQPMLDLPQEAVTVFQQRPLLMRQAAAVFQLGDRLERVAGAQGGQVAAVEQLQELDDEFDVADAAVAGFDVAAVGPFALGCAARCGA